MNSNTNEQQAAFDKLSKLRAGALFMACGTGKTKVALDLVKSRQNDFDAVIWIAPASLIREKSYKAEIGKWADGLNAPINFFTIEGVSASDQKYLEMRCLAERARTFCVVDESITIKNTDAGRTKRLLSMWNMFTFRLILNGTPVTKGLVDLYSQINFIHPRILNMTEAQFANNFLIYKNDGWQSWKRWSKPENEAALIEILRPYIFDASLEIPVKIENQDVSFDLTETEQAAYSDLKQEFLNGKNDVGFLEVAQKFQHFYTQAAAKETHLQEFVKQAGERGEKVIVYVKFVDEVARLRRLFDCVVFTGGEKGNLVDFFAEKDVLICTYGVGSFGLNLQAANNIVYYSQTFDYKDKEQSKHRVYRKGQTRDVNIVNYWVNVGLENIIRQSLTKKENTLKNVKEFIEKNGAGAL